MGDAPEPVRGFVHRSLLEEGPWMIARVSSIIGLESRKQRVGLLLSMVVPLLVLGLAAWYDDRFALQSVFAPVLIDGKPQRLIGMSFLGDTMVWPFCLLVPCGVLLIGFAHNKSIRLGKAAEAKASPAWRADRSPSGLGAAITRTEAIWRMKCGGWGTFLRSAPWVIAFLLISYNTATCGLRWPNYPYESREVWIVAEPQTAQIEPEAFITGRFEESPELASLVVKEERWRAKLSRPIPLSKWDTDPGLHPRSFWASRIWTVFYYGLPPFLLAKLIALVWGVTSFLAAGKSWEEKQASDGAIPAFVINPYAADAFGGLAALSDAVIAYLYQVSFFAVLIGMSLTREGIEPSWHNYAMMLLFLPLASAVVFLPSLLVRHTIGTAKRRYLQRLSSQLAEAGDEILQHDEGGVHEDETRKALRARIGTLKSLYDQVRAMPEWPFDGFTLARMALPVLAPFLPGTVEKIASAYL